jgi:hypothetical protein
LVAGAVVEEDFFFAVCLWVLLCFFAFGALVDVESPVAGASAAIDAVARPKANTTAVIKVPDLIMGSPNGWY